jgi:hypothetical protein
MKSKIALFCLAASLIAGNALAIPQHYRAQQKVVTAGTTQLETVYVDSGKMRIDAEISGMKTTTILRPDRGIADQLMPGNLYVEVPIGDLQKMMANFQDESIVKREPVGTETVNGKICNKFKLHNGNDVSYLWLEKDSDIPVKMETEDKRVLVEWQNVVVGAQDAALFEIPTDYKKMDLGSSAKDLDDLSKNLDETPKDLKPLKKPDIDTQLLDLTHAIPTTKAPPELPPNINPKEPTPQPEQKNYNTKP